VILVDRTQDAKDKRAADQLRKARDELVAAVLFAREAGLMVEVCVDGGDAVDEPFDVSLRITREF
jgi:hypothetical protein